MLKDSAKLKDMLKGMLKDSTYLFEIIFLKK